MRFFDLSVGAVTICAGAALLSGCGDPQMGTAAGDHRGSLAPQAAAHETLGRSWMMPSASSEDLLYVSSIDKGDIYVYSYPQGKLVGTLTGFIKPGGE